MNYVLPLILLLLTIAALVINKKDVVSPEFLFTAPFAFSSVYLLINTSRWNVNLHFNSILLISAGVLSLFLGSFIGKTICKKIHPFQPSRIGLNINKSENKISINESIFFLFVSLIELLTIVLCIAKIREIAHSLGTYGTLSEEIYRYRNHSVYSSYSTSLGRGLDWLYQLNLALGYISGYRISYKIASRQRPSITLCTCFVLSVLTGLIKGGRQTTIQMAVAFAFYLFYFMRKENRIVFSKKTIIIGFSLIAIVSVSFWLLGMLLGRKQNADLFQYLAVYFSGGLRNFDEWIQKPHELPSIFGKMTFINIYPYLGRKFKVPEWVYTYDLPYLKANGRNSGNIYTTFYSFMYDFGIPGVIILSLLIGLISRIIYSMCYKNEKDDININLFVLLYGYVTYTLLFSFFSNKFYEGLVKQSFIKMFIILVISRFVIKITNVFSKGE